MTKRLFLILLVTIGVTAASLVSAADVAAKKMDARAVLAAMDRLAGRVAWPGFDPRAYPLAVFDGQDTLLFRHPAPPAEFKATDMPGVWRCSGLYPALTANSVIQLGNYPTATVLAGLPGTGDIEHTAAVVLHELFHVYQDQYFPGWGMDLTVLLSYPRQSSENLKQVYLEELALAKALKQETRPETCAWLRCALSIRRQRFAALAAEHCEFETANDWMEGLASYIEKSALGVASATADLEKGPDANNIRSWSYVLGPAKAALLDRLLPSWKQLLTSWRFVSLDAMLELAAGDGAPAVILAEEIARAAVWVDARVAEYGRLLERTRAHFATNGQWRVLVTAPDGKPLNCQGIDPQNQIALSADEVVHLRMFKYGSSTGNVTLLNSQWQPDTLEGITVLAEHQGIWRADKATFVGFTSRPEVAVDGDRVHIRAAGFDLDFSAASLVESGSTLAVTLR